MRVHHPFLEFYYIKMGTITMITRMLDPEQTCGINVEETVSLRQRLTRASIRFGSTAGELLSLWDTSKMDYVQYLVTLPSRWSGYATVFCPF